MVERKAAGGDSPLVPTIAELLTEYRRRTGASYEDMSRRVDGAITTAWFHKLTTQPPRSFPRDAATVQHLADLLQVPIPTILLGFAAALGLPVEQPGSLLSITLPPGSDILDPGDVEAVRAVVRQLVDARKQDVPKPINLARRQPPDLTRVAARWRRSEGRDMVERQDSDAENP